jgi:hypothetical protein
LILLELSFEVAQLILMLFGLLVLEEEFYVLEEAEFFGFVAEDLVV